MFSIKLDNPKSAEIEPQFYPQNWQVYDAVNGSQEGPNAPNEPQVTETVDDTKEEVEEGPVIEEVNPEDDSLLAPRDANISSRRSTRTRKTRKSKKSRKSKKVKLPASEEIIVKSESEVEATVSSQLPISEQVSQPGAQSNEQASPTHDENGNVIQEIKEEEEGPIIEEVNPDDYPLSPRVGNTNERAEIAVEASQMTVDAFAGTTDNESNVFEPADDNEDADDPIIEEVNPDDYPLGPRDGNAGQEAEASHVTVSLSPVPLRRSTRARKSGPINEQTVAQSAVNRESLSSQMEEEEGPMIEEVNPDDYPVSPWVGNTSTEAEMVENEASQMAARVGSVSRVVLRRSIRVRKSTINYALLPEAEEETHQDDPNTGTSDAEESDSGESETEMETDEPSETEESSSISANASDRRLSRSSFPCRHCEKEFSSKPNARRHEETLHTQSERPRPYVCSLPDCGKAFAYQSHLDTHRLIHSGLRPFTCGDCGAAFNQKSALNLHQRRHSDERPYACVVCPKAFHVKGDLDCHNLTHSRLKPYTCTDCGSSFTQKPNLERHRKGKIPCASRYAPSKRRPFSCTVAGCGKAYKSRDILNAHTLTHSGLKTFKCTVCGGTFTTKGTLKRHSRQLHGI